MQDYFNKNLHIRQGDIAYLPQESLQGYRAPISMIENRSSEHVQGVQELTECVMPKSTDRAELIATRLHVTTIIAAAATFLASHSTTDPILHVASFKAKKARARSNLALASPTPDLHLRPPFLDASRGCQY